MNEFDLLTRLKALPVPFDSAQVTLGMDNWQEAVKTLADPAHVRIAKKINTTPAGRQLLAAIFGNSPYLAQVLLRDVVFFLQIVNTSPEKLLATSVSALPSADQTFETVMNGLRDVKRRVALLTAVLDIANVWSLDDITHALSILAERTLQLACDHLLLAAAAEGSIDILSKANPSAGSGFIVLAMGKLGAGELNYSSDIDLIFLYDEARVRYRGKRDIADHFVRLGRNLVRLMQERTAAGYVFRTDLRLRPDPGATPIVVSVAAAEHYYESLGQNWERAAMIKARAIAGDIEAGNDFLGRIAPFVWRRNLDFAAIQDIHSIKRQIHAHKGHGAVRVAGHNVKLGRGGIREIEFFAQTQQLIMGGRHRELRVPKTCDALSALVALGRLDPAAALELHRCYEFLRRVEHRLQMIADEQTQTLPEDDGELQHIANFLGYQDGHALAVALTEVLHQVENHYGALFESAPDLGSESGNLVFTGAEDDPETVATLSRMGFESPEFITASVRAWHHGRIRATRSPRARELLTALMPRILTALAASAAPDAAFRKFDDFLAQLPAGVQLFSLFYSNPELLDLVAEIMGTAPKLAALIGRRPGLLDAVIGSDFHQSALLPESFSEALNQILMNARDSQDLLDFTRRFASEGMFQAGVRMLRSATDVTTEGLMLSALADAVLHNLLHYLTKEFVARHGSVGGGQIAILGLGKLGAREMTFDSDLDLIFVYDHAPGSDMSDGSTPLPVSQYYARFCQRMISALTALTAEGSLYDVDMRLRPTGSKGPVAVHFDGFARYQREETWTWEQMAMTRARVVAGDKDLADKVMTVIDEVFRRRREPAALAADVREMRRKIASHHRATGPWDIKYVHGGLLDAEFIAQFLLLKNSVNPEVPMIGDTAVAFARMATAGVLKPTDAEVLRQDILFLRQLQAVLRLCLDETTAETDFPRGLQNLLVKMSHVDHFAALEAKLYETETRIAASFQKYLLDGAKAGNGEESHGA